MLTIGYIGNGKSKVIKDEETLLQMEILEAGVKGMK